jgi:hypothetical protein
MSIGSYGDLWTFFIPFDAELLILAKLAVDWQLEEIFQPLP